MKLVEFTDNNDNYKLMHEWCSKKFVYEWFEQRILSLNEIMEKYKAKLIVRAQYLYFLNYDEQNIGFIQIYKYADFKNDILSKYKNIYEYDLFIGEEEYLSKGIGTEIVDYINKYIYKNFNADCIILRPFKRNIRAIKCYQKNGFYVINEYEGTDTIGNIERYVVMINERIDMEILNIISSPQELLDFMDKNITYGFIGKNGKKYIDTQSQEWNDWYEQCTVQTGEEVLRSNIGACWDQVELERLWFQKKGYNCKTIFIWFELNREHNLPTHTFLLYEEGGKWHWFEHAFELYKGIYEFNTIEDAIEFIKDKLFEFAKNNDNSLNEDDRIHLISYEYSKLTNHLSVDEYIDFVTSKRK